MNTYKLFTRGMAVAALSACCWACTDDWDEHYNASEGANGAATLSLWQQIEANPDLQNFKILCEKTKFVAKEGTGLSDYTYADLLKTTGLTVFAPVITDEMRDYLLETGLVADNTEQVYSSQKRFLANHISRMQYTIVPGGADTSMYMLNAKKSVLDQKALTLNGVPLDPQNINIPTTNGKLNILKSPLPYAYNLYEYLKDSLNTAYSKFNAYVLQNDTAIFNPSLSTPADDPDENGNIVYIDKFYEHTNQLFNGSVYKSTWDYAVNGLRADLNCEDSAYAMVIPTDQAWEKAINKLKPYFLYARTYENNATRNTLTEEKGSGYDSYVSTLVKNEPYITDFDKALDSLAEVKARSYLMKFLTYNIRTQRNPAQFETPDLSYKAFDDWKNTASFLVTTSGDTLRNLPYYKYELGTDPRRCPKENDVLMSDCEQGRDWSFASIFDNQAPIRMSNGVGYLVDDFNFDVRTIVHKDIKVEAEFNVYKRNVPKADQGRSEMCSVHDTLQTVGLLSNNWVLDMKPQTSSKVVTIPFSLTGGVRSGTYDIYAVVAPYSYAKNGEANRQVRFTAALEYITNNSDKTPGTDVEHVVYNGDGTIFAPDSSKVDTVLLFKDFKFPVSYEGLGSCYPTISFSTIRPASSYGKTNTQTNNLILDFIYLKAKEEE